MPHSRRDFIRQSSLITGALSISPSIITNTKPKNIEGNRLVLLGTQGGPFIRSYKQTPAANLIVYNQTNYIIDTGYGVTFKLKDAGINLNTLKYIFITHLHSDHYLELGVLLYNAWIAGLSKPINVYAPKGLKHFLEHFLESNRYDIETRIDNEERPDIRKLIITHEIEEGTILKEGDTEIIAKKNYHPPVSESFAYKFKLGDKAVVFSGDTTYSASLINFYKNADYLVHEVMNGPAVPEMVKRRPNAKKLEQSILAHHTLAEDVGKIAKEAAVKNLILNHFVPPDDKSLTDDFWLKTVKTNFDGNVVVGKDLMEFPL